MGIMGYFLLSDWGKLPPSQGADDKPAKGFYRIWICAALENRTEILPLGDPNGLDMVRGTNL